MLYAASKLAHSSSTRRRRREVFRNTFCHKAEPKRFEVVKLSSPSAWRKDFDEIIDVRAPSEYADAHIPSAINIPVLNDVERTEVGTLHRSNPLKAKLLGASYITMNVSKFVVVTFIPDATYFGRKLTFHIRLLREHFSNKPASYRPLVYCWRGGQRSQSLHHILGKIGFKAALYQGGYKQYRQDVRENLPALVDSFKYRVLRGHTGTGKTKLLRSMARSGYQILDLEDFAGHRGSVLGSNPDGAPQPAQKLFECRIYHQLAEMDPSKPVWIEGEAKKIGLLHVPPSLHKHILDSPTLVLKVPIKERVRYILEDYSHLTKDPNSVLIALGRLKLYVGGEQYNEWTQMLNGGRWDQLVQSLMEKHYDPLSEKFLKSHDLHVFGQVSIDGLDDASVAAWPEHNSSLLSATVN